MKHIIQKDSLLYIISNLNLNNSVLIYSLLKNNKLDIVTKTLKNDKKKNRYDENHIKKIDYFINIFSNDFYFIGKQKNIILETIFAFNDNNDVFFSTYNITDNKYIEYFKIEMQKK
ncbi:MAG: hypothetical protein PHD20_06575 [Clostridia bacterium]|nr:hypothetical protein [Clostridia bacterium]